MFRPAFENNSMTDIQQWRRMIQPTRAKTPAVDADDAEAFLSPMSPRKGLKPKFTSYFTPQGHDPGAAQKDTAARNNTTDYDTPVWPAGDSYPNPDPDVLLDSVMCRLLGTPYEGLHPRFNSLLLQIFEGFRNLSDEKQQLLSQLQQGSSRLSDIEKAMQKSTRQWSQERHDYKAEIKRLELLLAKGKRGLAEVTLARQDSNLRKKQADRSKEGSKRDTIGTIVDFLEKTKREDEKYWSSQRGRRQSSQSYIDTC